MLEKGLFYHGMFQNFNTLTLIKQIDVLLENFTEFESYVVLDPLFEVTLLGLYGFQKWRFHFSESIQR
jgi:hypothetical protein